ncbi:hypothetical protein B0H17DRAFT_1205988 [Mycena rosella]|uniref:Uncharacterized protein n=1 Tax=Mycena rosella TaxID=1033263 RepID=A0AAD7D5X0_MYCRO|nr:hypothetical protein B0H17DRAFT_1205988 [Mycena rosella]
MARRWQHDAQMRVEMKTAMLSAERLPKITGYVSSSPFFAALLDLPAPPPTMPASSTRSARATERIKGSRTASGPHDVPRPSIDQFRLHRFLHPWPRCISTQDEQQARYWYAFPLPSSSPHPRPFHLPSFHKRGTLAGAAEMQLKEFERTESEVPGRAAVRDVLELTRSPYLCPQIHIGGAEMRWIQDAGRLKTRMGGFQRRWQVWA